MDEKLCWQGRLMSVQPRIRLTRSFDQRSHSYLGYFLLVEWTIDNNEAELLVGIGKAAQTEHQFRAGDIVSGKSCRVLDARTESVEFYKTIGLGTHTLEAREGQRVADPQQVILHVETQDWQQFSLVWFAESLYAANANLFMGVNPQTELDLDDIAFQRIGPAGPIN